MKQKKCPKRLNLVVLINSSTLCLVADTNLTTCAILSLFVCLYIIGENSNHRTNNHSSTKLHNCYYIHSTINLSRNNIPINKHDQNYIINNIPINKHDQNYVIKN
jgi:hypothetical protein